MLLDASVLIELEPFIRLVADVSLFPFVINIGLVLSMSDELLLEIDWIDVAEALTAAEAVAKDAAAEAGGPFDEISTWFEDLFELFW